MNKLPTPYKKGQRYTTAYGELRIMCIADNYAMVRYKGCAPFCMHVVQFRYFMKTINAKLIT